MRSASVAELESALREIPLLDAHTHLDASHLAARHIGDVVLYHMVGSDLYSAGCPEGARLSENPSDAEVEARIVRALPWLPAIQNTSCCWALRVMLRDLYDWTEPVTAENWRRLDGLIRERAADRGWAGSVFDKAKIRRSSTELWRGHQGQADDRLQYSLEWAFFARCQWGEFDTALFELENVWAQERPSPPLPVSGGVRPQPAKPIRTLDDVHAALDHYDAAVPWDRILTTAQHISTDIAYRPVSEQEMSAALERRATAGPAERDVYASYILAGFLERMARHQEKVVFHFSLAAEPLPFETMSRLHPQTVGDLAGLIQRFPAVHFQCFTADAGSNQGLCTLARELPNFSLAGYWWHSFFPPFIRRAMHERLDMLSVNKQVGFFSDAYCVEWAYAKATLVRKMLAQVLAEKIEQGQYDFDLALSVARSIFYDTPCELLGMVPRQ